MSGQTAPWTKDETGTSLSSADYHARWIDLLCSMNGHNVVIIADPASPKKNITIKGEYEFCHLSDENCVIVNTEMTPNPNPAENPADV